MTQTLVIVPGWGGTKETWQSCVNELHEIIDDIRVIELPCFGNEPCPTEVWGVTEYAQFLTGQLKEIEAERIIVLGHSFGGAVSARAIAETPELVDALILVGAAIVRPRRMIKRSLSLVIAKVGKQPFKLPLLSKLYAPLQRRLYRTLDATDYLETEGMKRRIYQKINREDQQQCLSRINIPVRILWGKKDTMTPLRYGKKIFRQLPAATLRIVPDGRHGLHHTHIPIIKEVVLESLI